MENELPYQRSHPIVIVEVGVRRAGVYLEIAPLIELLWQEKIADGNFIGAIGTVVVPK
jgi:hypothetical protein